MSVYRIYKTAGGGNIWCALDNRLIFLDLCGWGRRNQRIQLNQDPGKTTGSREVFLARVVRKRTVSTADAGIIRSINAHIFVVVPDQGWIAKRRQDLGRPGRPKHCQSVGCVFRRTAPVRGHGVQRARRPQPVSENARARRSGPERSAAFRENPQVSDSHGDRVTRRLRNII